MCTGAVTVYRDPSFSGKCLSSMGDVFSDNLVIESTVLLRMTHTRSGQYIYLHTTSVYSLVI